MAITKHTLTENVSYKLVKYDGIETQVEALLESMNAEIPITLATSREVAAQRWAGSDFPPDFQAYTSYLGNKQGVDILLLMQGNLGSIYLRAENAGFAARMPEVESRIEQILNYKPQ